MKSEAWELILHNKCPYKKKRLADRHTQREDHMKTEREDRHLQAKERSFRKKKKTLMSP